MVSLADVRIQLLPAFSAVTHAWDALYQFAERFNVPFPPCQHVRTRTLHCAHHLPAFFYHTFTTTHHATGLDYCLPLPTRTPLPAALAFGTAAPRPVTARLVPCRYLRRSCARPFAARRAFHTGRAPPMLAGRALCVPRWLGAPLPVTVMIPVILHAHFPRYYPGRDILPAHLLPSAFHDCITPTSRSAGRLGSHHCPGLDS